MNSKKIYSFILLLFGEILIIVSFLYFGKNLSSDLLILNTIVSSIIYLLWFIEKFIPIIDLKDKSQKEVASLGLKWIFTVLYAIAAIGVMVFFNIVKPLEISAQIIFHTILFFFLLVGLYFVYYTSHKVLEVFIEEKKNLSQLDEMKKATKKVQLKIDQMTNIPNDIIKKLNEIQENLRYLSPSKNIDTIELENDFINQMKTVNNCLFENSLNFDKIMENIMNCERIYKERKQIFSN